MRLKTFLLVLLIFLCVAFIYTKVMLLGDQTSNFNKTSRFWLGGYSLMRTIFGLHNDGDARAWFLEGQSPLIVEVVQARGTVLSDVALQAFVSQVKKYTGRPVQLVNNDIIDSGILSYDDLENVVAEHRRNVLFGQPNLFLIYADDYSRQGTELASTYKEYGIVLSDRRLKEITRSFSSSLSQYQQSTLLHEFGHQIGLGHDDARECIMNASVDTPEYSGEFRGIYTPTDFCESETKEITSIKQQLK